jgi:L-asparaginase
VNGDTTSASPVNHMSTPIEGAAVSSQRKRILIVMLGGTISMTNAGNGLVPTLSGEALLSPLSAYLTSDIEIAVENRTSVASPNLSFAVVRELAVSLPAKMRHSDICGVVVVQGTDTIEETSFLLDLLLAENSKPVVVTGAMRGADSLSPDGPANLLASIRVASEPASADRGVLVVLNEEIHAAAHVVKVSTSQVNAFSSPNGGPVGVLSEGAIHYFNNARLRANIPASCSAEREPPVALLKIGFSDDGRMLRILPRLGFEGTVIEAMGAGHVPGSLVPSIGELRRHMPVILASRTGSGFVHTKTYSYPGSETDLLSCGLFPSGHLNALKARILLMTALACDCTRGGIEDAFKVYGFS